MLVQKLRLHKGWSQQQLSDLSGLSVRTIQRIERGHSASTESLKSLAAVFEIDFSNFLEEPVMDAHVLNPRTNHTDEILAFEHVRKVRRFYMHLVQYLVVVGALTAVNLIQTPHRFWVLWVIVGWGVGLLSHALSVFEILPFFGAEWERRQVEQRLGRPL